MLNTPVLFIPPTCACSTKSNPFLQKPSNTRSSFTPSILTKKKFNSKWRRNSLCFHNSFWWSSDYHHSCSYSRPRRSRELICSFCTRKLYILVRDRLWTSSRYSRTYWLPEIPWPRLRLGSYFLNRMVTRTCPYTFWNTLVGINCYHRASRSSRSFLSIRSSR